MAIGIGTLASVIIFFLGVMLLLITYFTRKSVKTDTLGLGAISQEIVDEIEKSTENSILKLEKVKEEIDEKIKELTEKEENIEKMYNEILKEKTFQNKKIVPKLTPMDDKKMEIYRLYNEGMSPEKISQSLKVHKGIVETVLNFGEFEKIYTK